MDFCTWCETTDVSIPAIACNDPRAVRSVTNHVVTPSVLIRLVVWVEVGVITAIGDVRQSRMHSVANAVNYCYPHSCTVGSPHIEPEQPHNSLAPSKEWVAGKSRLAERSKRL